MAGELSLAVRSVGVFQAYGSSPGRIFFAVAGPRWMGLWRCHFGEGPVGCARPFAATGASVLLPFAGIPVLDR